jgi:hypothetical protein
MKFIFANSLRTLRQGTTRRQRHQGSKGRRPSSFAPRLEGLEERAVLSAVALTVENTADSGPGSLREAVDLANWNIGHDTIKFAKGVAGTIRLTSGELAITDDLTIDGPSSGKVKISGNDANRIFIISGTETDVTINDLTLVNGLAEGAGGAILHIGKTLSLTNTEFKHNQAVGTETEAAAGGAVAILANIPEGNYPFATIEDSRFTQNQAIGGDGGTLGGAFGGAINNQGHVTITGSTLTHNGVFGGDDNENQGQYAFVGLAFGGAINNNSGGTLVMDDCVVTHNQAVAGDRNTGGAESYVGDAGGGGIQNIFGATGTISNSTITHNMVVGGDEATTEGNVDGGFANGGGIGNLFFAVLTVEQSVISHNQVVAGDRSSRGEASGGGIHNAVGSTLMVYDSDVTRNSASGGQDAIGVDAGSALGGGIQNFQSLLTVKSSRVTDNRVTGGSMINGNGGVANGGGLNNSQAGATIIDSVFSNNQVRGGHGVVGGNGQGGGIANIGAELIFAGEKSVVTRNHARGGSGTSAAGEGLGGGIFNFLGSVDSAASVPDVFGNHASDGDDDLFGLTLP